MRSIKSLITHLHTGHTSDVKRQVWDSGPGESGSEDIFPYQSSSRMIDSQMLLRINTAMRIGPRRYLCTGRRYASELLSVAQE